MIVVYTKLEMKKALYPIQKVSDTGFSFISAEFPQNAAECCAVGFINNRKGVRFMNFTKFTQKSIQAVNDLEKLAYEYGAKGFTCDDAYTCGKILDKIGARKLKK